MAGTLMSSFDPLPDQPVALGPDLGVPPTRQATPVTSGRAEDACLLFRKCRQVGMHRFIEQERRGHPRLHKTKQRSPCQFANTGHGLFAESHPLQGTRGVKLAGWLKHKSNGAACLGGPTSWLRTPYSSNDWPVRLLPRPPFPFPLSPVL